MKQSYDFSKGKRGRIAPPEPETRGKTHITIRLDEDLVDHFLREADASGEYRAACGRRQDFGPGQARWPWQPPIVVLRCCEGR